MESNLSLQHYILRYIAIMWNIPVAREVAVKKPSNVRQNQNFIMSPNSVPAQELYLDNPVNNIAISAPVRANPLYLCFYNVCTPEATHVTLLLYMSIIKDRQDIVKDMVRISSKRVLRT